MQNMDFTRTIQSVQGERKRVHSSAETSKFNRIRKGLPKFKKNIYVVENVRSLSVNVINIPIIPCLKF